MSIRGRAAGLGERFRVLPGVAKDRRADEGEIDGHKLWSDFDDVPGRTLPVGGDGEARDAIRQDRARGGCGRHADCGTRAPVRADRPRCARSGERVPSWLLAQLPCRAAR